MVVYHDIHNTSCISCTIVYNKTIEREEATMPNTNPYIHLADKLLEIVETPQQLTKLSEWLADSQTVSKSDTQMNSDAECFHSAIPT